LQERKSAKARAQFAKFKNKRNEAIKQARAQERKGAIGVRAEVTAGVTAEAWQKKILLYARKCVIMVIDIRPPLKTS